MEKSLRTRYGSVECCIHVAELRYFSCSSSFFFYTEYLIILGPALFLNIFLKITYFVESYDVHVRLGNLTEGWNLSG